MWLFFTLLSIVASVLQCVNNNNYDSGKCADIVVIVVAAAAAGAECFSVAVRTADGYNYKFIDL